MIFEAVQVNTRCRVMQRWDLVVIIMIESAYNISGLMVADEDVFEFTILDQAPELSARVLHDPIEQALTVDLVALDAEFFPVGPEIAQDLELGFGQLCCK